MCIRDSPLHIEHSFENLIEQQPIGMKLFNLYCERDLLLCRCIAFIQALDDLQLLVDEKYTATARKTYEEYISTSVRMICLLRCSLYNVYQLLVLYCVGYGMMYSLCVCLLPQSHERLSPVTVEMAAKVERDISPASDVLPNKSVFHECRQ